MIRMMRLFGLFTAACLFVAVPAGAQPLAWVTSESNK